MDLRVFLDSILNLGADWEVSHVEVIDDDVFIHVDYKRKFWIDTKTGESLSIYDHRDERAWRHLDLLQYKTWIVCRVPRVKDGKTIRTIDTPWAKDLDRHTIWFEALVIDLLLATKNQTKTANLLRMGFNQVNRIMHRAVHRGLAVRNLDGIEDLSIDEKSFRRGHYYVTVLSDPKNGRILNVTEDRTTQAALEAFTSTFNLSQLDQIKTVSVDMWKAYMSAGLEACPNAVLCHDKFHLIQHMNKAVDQVRRQETKTIQELKGTRYIWLKDHGSLTDYQREKYQTIKDINYETAIAWRIKENLRDCIPLCGDKSAVAFLQWLGEAKQCALKPVQKVAEMFSKHLHGILNALMKNKSNAMAEKLNGKIQEIKLSAKGYKSYDNFRSAILFFNGKLDLKPQGSW